MSVQLSIIVIRGRDNSLVHKLRVMAAVELHVNAIYYMQHPALESVYGKGQQISYFPPTGQCLAQGLLDIPKQLP